MPCPYENSHNCLSGVPVTPSDSHSFVEILDESTLSENSMEIVEVSGRKVVLVKSASKIYALDNTCPHLGGSLGRGTLKNGTVIRPLHHWTFELSSGKCLNGVPDEKVAAYEVKVENEKILVKLP